MDIKDTFAAIRRIEDSDDYRHSSPVAIQKKAKIEDQISKWVWE